MIINDPHFKERIQKGLERHYFLKHIGFTLDKIEAGRTEGSLCLEKLHMQRAGYAHGGVVATLADSVAGFAASTLMAPNYRVVTGDLNVSYLRPGLEGQKLFAIGWVLKQGKKVHFCEAEVWSEINDKRELITKASATMIVIPPTEDLA